MKIKKNKSKKKMKLDYKQIFGKKILKNIIIMKNNIKIKEIVCTRK